MLSAFVIVALLGSVQGHYGHPLCVDDSTAHCRDWESQCDLEVKVL